jgi:hypothetical protein
VTADDDGKVLLLGIGWHPCYEKKPC